MPLVNSRSSGGVIVANPTSQQPADIPVVAIFDPKYKGIVVDTRYTPETNLLTHIAGYAWTVDYYSQVIGTDSSLSGQRPSSAPIHQQYKKIERMVIRVSNPLSLTQDAETKQMVYTGTALVHSIIPNEGDMFVATIGDGSVAILHVGESSKKAVYQTSVYEIGYQVASQSEQYLHDLENKVVDHLVWREELMPFGQTPVILKSRDDLLAQAANTIKVVVRQYFDRFYSNEYGTLIAPGQVGALYDPYLAYFMTQMLNSDDCLEMIKMKVLNVKDDPVYKQNNLWLAIANQNELMLESGFTRAGMTETWRFDTNPFFAGIRFSGVTYAVYPKNPTVGIQGVVSEKLKDAGTQALVPSTGGELTMFEDTNTGILPLNVNAPNLYRVTFDDYYVLSQNFYDQTTQQSTLEVLVRHYLKREAIDLEALMLTAHSVNKWGLLEQFYYTPIVLALMRGGMFQA